MPEVSIEGFRLSPQQKRLWLLQQSVSSQPYRTQCAVLIEGYVNLKIIETALNNVVAQHEIFRTNFKLLPGMTIPIQVINNNGLPNFLYDNFTELSPEEQEVQIQRFFNEASQLNFDLENSSVLQVSLCLLAPNKHILLISLPAISADKLTLQNFVREMSHAYDACLHDKELSDTTLQYADFAEWQNELFEGEEAEVGKEYWRKKNIAEFIDLNFFLEKSNTDIIEFEPKFITQTLNNQEVKKLKKIAQNYNISLSTVLLTCWQVFLWYLTRKSDIVVGTYSDGRNYEELESALGLFAKYLPIECHFEEDLTFSEVLQQVKDSITDVFKWQESFTWDEIIASTEKNNKIPFFPVCFDFEEQPSKYSVGDLSFDIYRQYVCLERFKVKLFCCYSDESLKLELYYDENIFLREKIEVLAEQFQVLLESAIETPEATIDELKILRKQDLHQLIIEFNQTQTSDLTDNCIHHLFEEQVSRTPDNIAVVFENEQLTYRELNNRANQLAHHLQKLGVGPETVVGLYVQRSLDMVVGLLGILKAGGAYLPLDPALPSQAVAFRLHDAKVSLVVSHSSLLSSSGQMTVVCLDTHWNAIAQEPDTNLQSEVTNENLVYVLFTSGSTGQPKGVAVEHRQLLNYLNGILEKLVPTGASFATVSTFAADLGNTVIFPSLCTGGCLHIVSQERAQDPQALADYCRLHPIDCLKIVPSHLAALLTTADCKEILPRQCLVLGGEAASWELIEQIRQYNPNCRILNHYGPTEATVGVTTFTVETQPAEIDTRTVPLGKPLANTQIYLLNRHLQPVPVGVPGELYIGGASLARGYLNQPELTTARFIANPFDNSKSSRLYKTGDLARYLSDGNIEFLGRVDHQVKVRGFRIELGEIEAVLSQHPMVREAVVLMQQEELANQRLVAYIVPDEVRMDLPETDELTSTNLQLSHLQSFLRQQLPEYMMPSAFLLLKHLPRTPNGKVDRQALLTTDGVRLELAATYVAPQTEVEEAIATLWRQMLHLEKVSIHHNFFDLGGHSLLVVQMCHKLREIFNTDISITDLFKYPTISSLAAYLNQEQNKQNPIVEDSHARTENHKNLRKRQIQSRQKQRTTLQRESQDE